MNPIITAIIIAPAGLATPLECPSAAPVQQVPLSCGRVRIAA